MRCEFWLAMPSQQGCSVGAASKEKGDVMFGIFTKFSFALLVILLFASVPTSYAANKHDDYMQGHPSYNDNYYNPSYNNSHSTPNSDSDYYNRQHSYNNNYDDGSNDAPHGNDIRDYNPYYDRDGNLKQ